MEILTLPEPAAGLWAAKRSIVHAIPPEMFRSNIPPHLGGGTIRDSASRSSIDMIDRLDDVDLRRPQPTVPGQAQARTRNNDHGYDR